MMLLPRGVAQVVEGHLPAVDRHPAKAENKLIRRGCLVAGAGRLDTRDGRLNGRLASSHLPGGGARGCQQTGVLLLYQGVFMIVGSRVDHIPSPSNKTVPKAITWQMGTWMLVLVTWRLVSLVQLKLTNIGLVCLRLSKTAWQEVGIQENRRLQCQW